MKGVGRSYLPPAPFLFNSLRFPQMPFPWLTASFFPNVPTVLGTCSLHVGNVFPIRRERVPNKLGIKFHLAWIEWHSYVAGNERLTGIVRLLLSVVFHLPVSVFHLLVSAFSTACFRLSASACLSAWSPQSYPSVWLSAFNSYPEGSDNPL